MSIRSIKLVEISVEEFYILSLAVISKVNLSTNALSLHMVLEG
jgi:hypothetical protein